MEPEEIKKMIESGLTTSFVKVDGDGSHFEAIIVSEDFEGKLPVERHKLVYSALGDAMDERIHALSMKTYTSEQWDNINNNKRSV